MPAERYTFLLTRSSTSPWSNDLRTHSLHINQVISPSSAAPSEIAALLDPGRFDISQPRTSLGQRESCLTGWPTIQAAFQIWYLMH
jgi:hypothetical protein